MNYCGSRPRPRLALGDLREMWRIQYHLRMKDLYDRARVLARVMVV